MSDWEVIFTATIQVLKVKKNNNGMKKPIKNSYQHLKNRQNAYNDLLKMHDGQQEEE